MRQDWLSWVTFCANDGSVERCNMTVVVSGVAQSTRQVNVVKSVVLMTTVEPLAGAISVMVGAAALAAWCGRKQAGGKKNGYEGGSWHLPLYRTVERLGRCLVRTKSELG